MSKTFLHRINIFVFAIVILIGVGCQMVNGQSGAAEALIKKAKDHLSLFQYDQAQTLLTQAIQLEPDNWEPYFLAGRALMRQKKEQQAEKYLEKANKLNANEMEVQKALGALYIYFAKEAQKESKLLEMTNFLHKACLAYPEGTKIWQSLLENWWRAGAYDKIKQEGNLIVQANKAALERHEDKSLQAALIIVAKVYFQEGDFENADKFIESASSIRPHNDDIYTMKRELKSKTEESVRKLIDLANQSFNKGDYDEALKHLQNAKKMPGAKSDVASLMEKIGREASLMKVISESDALIAESKFKLALEKLEEATLEYPEDKRVTEKMALVSGKVGKIEAEAAKARAEQIATKKQILDRKRQYDLFCKEGADNADKHNYDLAIISFEKALKLAPDQVAIKKQIIDLQAKAKRAKELRDAFAINLTELEKTFTAGDYDSSYKQGQKMLTEYSTESDSSKSIALIHAEICLRLEKNDEARKMLIFFEEDKDHQQLYLYIKGILAYRAGERDEALEALKKISSSFRSDISSTIWWIYLYKYQGGLYIVMLILIFPAVRFAKDYMARLKTSQMLRKIESIKQAGTYEKNLAFLEERYEKDDTPNPKQIAVMLAEAFLRAGNTQKAYEIASALLKKDSRNANARRIAGEACLQLEDTSPAGMEYIQGLLKIDGSRKPVVLFLAKTYMASKADHKMAQDFIQEAIAFNPGDTQAIAYLADTYIKRQTYSQQSVKIFEKAIKAAPDEPDYYQGIIENFNKIDNFTEAENWLAIAREKFPEETSFFESKKSSTVARQSSAMQRDGSLPDYENIGNDQPAAEDPFAGGFPDYESIGEEPPVVQTKTPAAVVQPKISGPTKNCPHCNALNPIKEYYCTTCGKSFG